MNLILCVGLLSCASAVVAVQAPAPSHSTQPQVNAIEGTWIYAKDPTGAVRSESIYEGSTITFGPGGQYTFQLGQTSIALKGTWELRGAEGDTLRVHTEYGEERRNDLTLKVRRNPRGEVIGLEVREGDESAGARYYVPRRN